MSDNSDDWRETDAVDVDALTEADIQAVAADAKSLDDLQSRLGDLAGERGDSPIPGRDNWERDAVVLNTLQEQAADGEDISEGLVAKLPELLEPDVRRLYEAQRQGEDDDIIVG